MISLTRSLSANNNITDLGPTPKGTPIIFAEIEVEWVNFRLLTFNPLKWCKIGSKLLLTTNRNMYRRFRLVLKSTTMDDIEVQ